jgi:hypothetical protein
MNNLEILHEKTDAEKESELLTVNSETKNTMLQSLNDFFEADDVWNAIITAGEMALLGIDIKKDLDKGMIEKIQNLLAELRKRLKDNDDPDDYIDLARTVYRLKNIGIDFPDLNSEEIEKLRILPELIRHTSDWDIGHLAYIPQIAAAINEDPDLLKHQDDGDLVEKYSEQDIVKNQDDDKQFSSMIICGGLLAKFDVDAAKKLLESEAWKNGKSWTEILNYFEKLEREKNGYFLARLLPPMQSLIKFKNNLTLAESPEIKSAAK